MKATLLVAHPDDEVLFAGGLLLSHPEVEWEIACATYKDDHTRGQRWATSVSELEARGLIITGAPLLGLTDDSWILHTDVYAAWKKRITASRVGKESDIVVTHGRLGEYGHPHHMALAAISRELFESPWHFFCKAPSGVGEQERLSFFHRVPLDGGLAIVKRRIMELAYPDELAGLTKNQPSLIDWAFTGPEVFTSNTGGWA